VKGRWGEKEVRGQEIINKIDWSWETQKLWSPVFL
jgi:hypothetical protein